MYNGLISFARRISIIHAIIFSALLIVGAIFSFAFPVQARVLDESIFPVSELGNCQNESECKAYCGDTGHIQECVAFGLKHGLMSQSEADKALRLGGLVIDEGSSGPGECGSHAECKTYCEDVSHIQECVEFGERHGVITGDELKEAKKVAAAVASGAQLPGGCKNKDECEVYCEDTGHMEECLAFAEAAGFIDGEELEEARRVMPLMQRGESPGGCRSRAQCEAYCDNESHFEECIAFAEKAGFIDAKDAEMARKTGGKGPGGCKRDECKTYCDNPAHQDECFAFAQEHGLLSEEELRHMKEGMGEFRRALDDAPPEVLTCLTSALGADTIAKIKSGDGFPPRDAEPRIRECFEKMGGEKRDEFFSFISEAPPEVVSCLLGRLGVNSVDEINLDSFEQGRQLEEYVRGCFEEFGPKPEDFMMDDRMMRETMGEGFDGEFHDGDDFDDVRDTMMNNFDINAIPAFARDCVAGRIGEDVSPEDIRHIINDCARNSFGGDINDIDLPEKDFPSDLDILPPEEFIEHGIERGFEPFDQFEPERDGSSESKTDFPEGVEESFQNLEGDVRQFETEFQNQFQRQFEEQFKAEQERIQQEFQNQNNFESFQREPQEFESFLAPQDDFIPDGERIEEPRSSAPSESFLGNVLTVVNLLFGL